MKQVVRDSTGKMIPVPNNWTSYFQPLDISVNKPCKDFLRNEAQTWYSAQIVEQIEAGKSSHEVKVDTRISVISYYYIVTHGWEKSLISEHINKKIELDPFVDL